MDFVGMIRVINYKRTSQANVRVAASQIDGHLTIMSRHQGRIWWPGQNRMSGGYSRLISHVDTQICTNANFFANQIGYAYIRYPKGWTTGQGPAGGGSLEQQQPAHSKPSSPSWQRLTKKISISNGNGPIFSKICWRSKSNWRKQFQTFLYRFRMGLYI